MSTNPSSVEPEPAPMPGCLIAYRPDRLGARLVSLMNAMRLAETLGVDYRCAWIRSNGVGQVFNDPTELFAADFVESHFLPEDDWRARRPAAMPLSGEIGRTVPDLSTTLVGGTDVIIGNAFGIILLEGEDQTGATTHFRDQFARIRFSAPVRAAMEKLNTELAGHTAYHIRRGDLTGDTKAMNKPWPHKFVPDEYYTRHMETELARGQRGVVLFSDEAATIADFRAAFPALKTIGDLVAISDLTEAQRDLIELYAMSRCERIIAPERSAFSSTAADIGTARKLAITADLSQADADNAAEALLRHLRDRPESFAQEGEIGQALVHTGDYLSGQERVSEAAALFAQHVRAGLNISFIYPLTMHYQHLVGDMAGVLETASHMTAGHVVHDKDYADARLLHGHAHLRLGDHAAAREQIINGFWHAPEAALTKLLIPLLLEAGVLDETNFLPVSSLQLRMQRRRGPLKTLGSSFPGMDATLPGAIPGTLGSFETALWDWAPLLPAVSLVSARRKGLVSKTANWLENAKTPADQEAERASLAAIMHAWTGKPERAAKELAELANTHPDHAMTWQRLSHAHWQARDFKKATEAARRAVTIGDLPAIHAWAGMTLLRTRQTEAAVEHLTLAVAALPAWPSILGLLAQAEERAGHLDEALAAAARAFDRAPADAGYALLLARLLDKAGRPEDAVATLQGMVEIERASGRLYLTLIAMLRRQGEDKRAEATISLARARLPQHAGIAELAGAA